MSEPSPGSDPEKVLLNSLLFESNPLPCFIIDKPSLSIKGANDAASIFYGYSLKAFQQMRLSDLQQDKKSFIPLEDWELIPQTRSAKQVFFHEKKNGELVIAELYLNPFLSDSETLCQVSVVDITHNLSVQEKLATDWERYKVFIEQSSEGIYRQELMRPMPVHLSFEQMIEHIKSHLILAECNVAMAQMYGYEDPSEIVGATAEQLLDFSNEANIRYLKHFVTNGFKVTDAESHEKDKEGASRYFLNNAVGIIENGFLLRIWGTQRNITEKKAIEEKIKLLANLVEQTSDVLTAADLNFIPLTWNNASEKIYGITADQAIGTDIRKYVDIRYYNATRDEVRAILKQKGEWRGETYFLHPQSGKEVTLLSTFKLLRDENGEPLGYVISGTDITERKASESALKESEQRFRTMADSAPVMIWMTNRDNKLTYMNKPMLEYTGIRLETHGELTWSSLVHPADLQKSLLDFKHCFDKQLPVTLIYRLKNGADEYRWVQDSGTPRFLEDKTFVGYIGSIVEIHDTKLKEEKLQYQATVLENVLDIVVTTDLDFSVITWNRYAADVYGCTEEEAIGRKITDLVRLQSTDASWDSALQILHTTGQWKGEVTHTNKQGIQKFFVQTVTYVYNKKGDKIGILSVGRDITERKEAEQKLQQSETFYRTLISDSQDGMLLVNPGGIITFASPSVKHTLAYEPEDVQGKSAFDFVHPDDYGLALQSLEKEVAKNPEYKSIVIRLRKKDGTWLWCMIRAHNLLDNPYVQSIVLYFHDDTLRKKASDALKESEQRFRTLVSEMQIGVILYDNEGKIIMCNKMVLDLHNTTEERLKSKNIYDIIPQVLYEDGSHFPEEERPLFKALKTKKTIKNVVMGISVARRTGVTWLMVNTDPILDENGNIIHIISSFNDITERKKLEEKLLLEQVGHQKGLTQATIDGQEKERREIGKELHDNIGQQLTTTKLFLDMALSTSNSESQEMISMALRSVSDLINEVRGISRSLTPPTLGDLGLIDSIYDLIETIERTQTIAIELDTMYFSEDELPENKKLMLFRIIQEQLNNIIKHSGAQQVQIVLNNDEGDTTLEIKDNGKGFDPLQSKIGLGLTNIKNRCELFGGRMEIKTSLGNGCTLRLHIPSSSKE